MGDGIALAWQRLAGTGPCVVFLPGFKSDMAGDKATALAELCAQRGPGDAAARLQPGMGAAAGRSKTERSGAWRTDALGGDRRVDRPGRLLLVGSSMGGWIGLLVALARPERVAGFLVGIAAAPDFTETMMWEAMTFEERAALLERGMLEQPSDYGAPYVITRALIEDGRSTVADGRADPDHGAGAAAARTADRDVPWELSLRLAARLTGADVPGHAGQGRRPPAVAAAATWRSCGPRCSGCSQDGA